MYSSASAPTTALPVSSCPPGLCCPRRAGPCPCLWRLLSSRSCRPTCPPAGAKWGHACHLRPFLVTTPTLGGLLFPMDCVSARRCLQNRGPGEPCPYLGSPSVRPVVPRSYRTWSRAFGGSDLPTGPHADRVALAYPISLYVPRTGWTWSRIRSTRPDLVPPVPRTRRTSSSSLVSRTRNDRCRGRGRGAKKGRKGRACPGAPSLPRQGAMRTWFGQGA